jgi:hypothetical protein
MRKREERIRNREENETENQKNTRGRKQRENTKNKFPPLLIPLARMRLPYLLKLILFPNIAGFGCGNV